MTRLTALGLAVLTIFAAPLVRAAIVKGPYLQDVRADGITFAAETDEGESCAVLWGDGLSQRLDLVADGIHHEASLTGLDASTCFPYQLECGGQVSAERSFCTAAVGDEPFRFVVVGDTRTDHEAHADVIRAVAAEGPDFVVNTGDLVSNGGDEEDWIPFFDVEGDLLSQVPMFPVVGNHDEVDGQIVNYGRLFAVPTESSGSENYYAFTYGNARFIVLDNQGATLARPEDETDQGLWLTAELQALAGRDDLVHRFVFVHANMYSADDGRSGDEGLRQWRDAFVSAGVDVVFSGHDHHYVRGWADNGLPFVVSGGGGAPLYDFSEALMTSGEVIDVAVWGWLPEPGDKPFSLIWTKKVHHYVVVDVQGGRVDVTTKEVLPGQEGPGVAFDSWSWDKTEPDPDPDPDPDDPKNKSGCATTGDSVSLGLLLCGLALLIRRRRG